jgi:hypothetical protein
LIKNIAALGGESQALEPEMRSTHKKTRRAQGKTGFL